MTCRCALGLVVQTLALAGQADFCALTLRMQTPRGEPITGTAKLIDERGTVVESIDATAGEVRFCDMDFGSYSVLVQAQSYLSTTVSGIRVRYFEPLLLVVVLNYIPGGDGSTNGCAIDIRVKDQSGANVPFPTLSRAGDSRQERGDGRGRIATAVLLGRQRDFVIGADGYQPSGLSVNCASIMRFERTIVLNKK